MSKQEISACRVVRARKTMRGKQELFYNVGVSAKSVGAHEIKVRTYLPKCRGWVEHGDGTLRGLRLRYRGGRLGRLCGGQPPV